MGKFARLALQTANLDYNGRYCMVSAGTGNKKALGIDRAPNPWSDIPLADVVWVAGSNVAYANGVPYIAFRSLSDLAGGEAFDPDVVALFSSGLAEANASAVALAFLRAWRLKYPRAATSTRPSR